MSLTPSASWAILKRSRRKPMALRGLGLEAPSAEPAGTPDVDAPKRLYRDSEDVVVGGVASGLAAYFGIDPVFLRIAFILLAFANGVGVLIYLILWAAMPETKTAAQKLEMRGRPVNVANFRERVKGGPARWARAAVDRYRQRPAWRKILDIPVRIVDLIVDLLRRIVSVVSPVVRVVVGWASSSSGGRDCGVRHGRGCVSLPRGFAVSCVRPFARRLAGNRSISPGSARDSSSRWCRSSSL